MSFLKLHSAFFGVKFSLFDLVIVALISRYAGLARWDLVVGLIVGACVVSVLANLAASQLMRAPDEPAKGEGGNG